MNLSCASIAGNSLFENRQCHLVPADSSEAFCAACRYSRTISDLTLSYTLTPGASSFFYTLTGLGTALTATVAIVPTALKAVDDQPKRYHDKEHNDDHEWNDHQDRAYQKRLEEKHKPKREFAKLKAKKQREYWKWRHEHPDRD